MIRCDAARYRHALIASNRADMGGRAATGPKYGPRTDRGSDSGERDWWLGAMTGHAGSGARVWAGGDGDGASRNDGTKIRMTDVFTSWQWRLATAVVLVGWGSLGSDPGWFRPVCGARAAFGAPPTPGRSRGRRRPLGCPDRRNPRTTSARFRNTRGGRKSVSRSRRITSHRKLPRPSIVSAPRCATRGEIRAGPAHSQAVGNDNDAPR
jgi:hypothetical protein